MNDFLVDDNFCFFQNFQMWRATVCGGRWFFSFSNEVPHNNHSTHLGIKTTRPVHNHALASTVDLGSCFWFSAGSCYIGTFPTLCLRPAVSLWWTMTSAGFYFFYPTGIAWNSVKLNFLRKGCFFLEHTFVLWYLWFLLMVVVTLTFSLLMRASNKFHSFKTNTLSSWTRVFGSCHLNGSLLVILDLLYYYWIGKVVLNTYG